MKRNNRVYTGMLRSITLFALMFSVIISLESCPGPASQSPTYALPPSLHVSPDSAVKWVDWIVLFKPASTYAERTLYMDNLRDSLTQFVARMNHDANRNDPLTVQYVFCPCDSLLYNLVATTSITATGTIATSPTPPPKTGASGDPYLYAIQNNQYQDSTTARNLESPSPKSGSYTVDSSRVLAIMDTGLDSTLFDQKFNYLLWSDPTGEPTLRNFQFFSNLKGLDYYLDDDPFKHGSAVTSLALEALRIYNTRNNKLPRIMVLKVLDSKRLGSTFTVSCALSYAVQKKATLANASLGYYSTGEVDSVLRFYVELSKNAKPNPLPIIAAAGNLTGKHDLDLCTPVTDLNKNKLTSTHLFYPGCFSPDYYNVICVTGLKNDHMPCYYQNYSPDYVNIGVITNPPPGPAAYCCNFPVSFFNISRRGYEGSSFATPVVSGQIMAAMLINPAFTWRDALNQVGVASPGSVSKKVLPYNSTP
jgi:hypothetical protein